MSAQKNSQRPVLDETDREMERIAHAFRPKKKPLLVAVGVNLMLAILLLGLPYLHGRRIADTARRDFVKVARCFLGGEIAKAPGLSLPKGDRDHFAEKVMRAAASWPLCCRPLVRRLAPEPAFLLWPGVKQGAADLQATVNLTIREIEVLDRQRKLGLRRVPERGLQALRRMQAATVVLARAADTETHINNDALRWKKAPELAVPARLPLMASDDAILDVDSDGDALEAFALDRRGISYLRLVDGKVIRERARRTRAVRGSLRVGADRYLVWSMPDTLCARREDRCVNKPLGLAPYDKGTTTLKEPEWKLAGHPAGRVDRVLHMTDTGRVELLARASATGAIDLLRFQIASEDTTQSVDQTAATIGPAEWFTIASGAPVLDATLVADDAGSEPVAVLFAHATDFGITVEMTWADTQRESLVLPQIQGKRPWTLACATEDDARILAYGSSSELRVLRLDTSGAITPLLQHEDAIEDALHAEDPALDRVQLLCDKNRSQLIWSNKKNELYGSVCETTHCGFPVHLADRAACFAALLTTDRSVIAFGNPADEVRIIRLDARGKPLGGAHAPAACFEPRSGMCGTPALFSHGQHVIVTARDHSDLLALESTDGAASFTTLSSFYSRK